jgi:hypothetical protein
MAVLSGRAGTLKLAGAVVTPIGAWKLTLTAEYKSYVANDTFGAVVRLPSAEDCSGSFDCKATEAGRCPVQRGQRVVAQFHVDGSAANYYETAIVVGRVAVACDILTGEVVSFDVEFLGSGPVSAHGVLAANA